MAKWIVASILGSQLGFGQAVRTLDERVAVGECIDAAALATYTGDSSLYLSQISGFPDSELATAEAGVTSAALIEIAYGQHFKVLTEKFSKEQYVLTQCGASQPTDAQIDAVASGAGYQRKHFTVPVQRVTAASTTILSFFRRLGVEDRVAYVDGSASHGCWQKALACGSKLESSWGGNATLREQQLNEVDVAFLDCGGDCDAVNARSNAVHVPATRDYGNLHSAEYIKFIAAFFNLEDVATQSFKATVSSYISKMRDGSSGPRVAWVSWNSWATPPRYELSQVTYRLQLTAAAGGRNVDIAAINATVENLEVVDAVPGNPAAGKTYYVNAGDNRTAAANALFGAMQDVDIVIDELYAAVPADYTYSDFLSAYFLTNTSTQKFISNQKVLRIDGTLSASNGYDWLESRIAYPDWAVSGLARYVADDPAAPRKYFRNVATAEQPEVITAETCTMQLPACDSSLLATPITLGAGLSTTLAGTMSAASSRGLLSIPAVLFMAMW